MIRVHRAGDAATFLAEAGPFLTRREAEHNLILGICSGLGLDPASDEEPPSWRTRSATGDVVAVALRTPPHNVVSESDELSWVEPIAREVHQAFHSLPGVPGQMRPYTIDDHGLTVQWLDAFVAEALPKESFNPPAETMLQQRLDETTGDMLVWEFDGRIPSIAAYGGPTPHGIRIGPRVTPHRSSADEDTRARSSVR